MSYVKYYGKFDRLTNGIWKIYTELFIKVCKIFKVSKNFDKIWNISQNIFEKS